MKKTHLLAAALVIGLLASFGVIEPAQAAWGVALAGTISLNGRLDEQVFPVQAGADLQFTGVPGDTKYVSLKGYRRIQIVIDIANGTTVTGAAVTLKQATAVAGTGEKALAFTRMLANIDTAASQAMVETAVAANTFTTDATNSKNLRYILEVDSESLDVANGFDCIRVDGTGHSATAPRGFVVSYNLFGTRYSGASPMAD
jgi:hypothetical protein